MRILLLTLALCILVQPSAGETTPALGIRSNNSKIKVFVNGTVVVSPTRTVERGMLIVREGRVVAVDSLPSPLGTGGNRRGADGAYEYDLTGKWVYPGFIDPFTEYGLKGVGRLNPKKDGKEPKYGGTRVGANAWNDAVHAEVDWIDHFVPDKDAAEKFLKRGVTAVQSAKMDGVFRGRGFVTSLATGLANDVVIKPRSLQFCSFNKGTSQQRYPSSLMGSIALIRQMFLDADWYVRAHQVHRNHPGEKMPEFNRATEALAANRGPFLFESDDELSLLRAARIAREFSVRFIHVGSNMEYNRIDAIADLAAPIILPVSFPKAPEVGSYEEELDVALADLRHWERAPSNALALAENRLEFAFTGHRLDDKEEDFLKNVRKTVKRGLAKETALAALTTIPAKLCGVDDLVGTLAAGKLANFFIADGDILDDDTRILSVWINGELAKEFHPLEETDFVGTYKLQLVESEYVLSISGKPGKLKGKLKAGDNSVDLKNVREVMDRVHFSVKMDDLGLNGVARFTLIKSDRKWTARVALPGDALPQPFAVDKTSDTPPENEEGDPDDEKDESEGSEEEEDTELISRTTFPNIAFGYDRIPQPEDVLLQNATVWTCEDGGVLESTDILVVDGKIVRIGKSLPEQSDIRTIDATGKHITPGMIDEHSHICISRGVNEGSHSVTSEVRIGDVVNSDHIAMYRALAGGVTTAQLLHGSANAIGGQAQVIKLRWGMLPEDLKFEAAPGTIKFALGENVKQSNWGDHNKTRYPQTRMGVETIMKDSFNAAREYEESWQRYNGLSGIELAETIPPRRDLRLEALQEILNLRRFIHCHSYMQAEILMLMRLAESFGFRVQTFTHILEGYKVAPEMAAHGAGGSSFSDWWAYKFEVYDAIPYNTCLMHKQGVVTSINSDSAEVMRRLNQEAAKSVMYCDMEETEALKMATLNPAIQLKIDHRVGSLKAGKDADFVIWNGHPLSMYSKVEQTWVDGTCYFSLEKDAVLREANRIEKQALIQKVMKSGKKDGGADNDKIKDEQDWHCDDVQDVWHAQNP